VHLLAQTHVAGHAGDLAVLDDHPLAALRAKHPRHCLVGGGVVNRQGPWWASGPRNSHGPQ
jgi:hypothetical protein